jgi:hypothetical protein
MSKIDIRIFLALMTLFLASSSWGCSLLIGQAGPGIVRSGGSIHNLQYKSKTQADIRDQFGEADETRTCPGSRIVECRLIRLKVDDPSMIALHAYTFGFAEIFLFPMMIYQTEKGKVRFAFVYDEAGRLLYVYDLQVPPIEQFNMATHGLAEETYRQLKTGKCATWSEGITNYVEETRQRANCLGYALNDEEEQEIENLFSIGEQVDLGQIPREEGLAAIRRTSHRRFFFFD